MFWAYFLSVTFHPLFDFKVYNPLSKPIAMLFSPCMTVESNSYDAKNDNRSDL